MSMEKLSRDGRDAAGRRLAAVAPRACPPAGGRHGLAGRSRSNQARIRVQQKRAFLQNEPKLQTAQNRSHALARQAQFAGPADAPSASWAGFYDAGHEARPAAREGAHAPRKQPRPGLQNEPMLHQSNPSLIMPMSLLMGWPGRRILDTFALAGFWLFSGPLFWHGFRATQINGSLPGVGFEGFCS
jgi:hypothetical protein